MLNLKEHFISVYKLLRRLLWILLEHFLRTQEVVENINFSEKKATCPVKKRFWPIFSRDMEHEKRQGTGYKGSQGILTFFVQMMWTFIWHLRGRLNQTFQKTAVLTMKEVFGPFFFVLSSVANLREQFIRVYRLFRQLLWNSLEHFLWSKGCWNHQFLKNSKFFREEKIWPIFSRNVEHENCQGTFYKSLQGKLTFIVQILWTFFWDQRGR